MKVLYITPREPKNIMASRGIYVDLLKMLVTNDHNLIILGSHNQSSEKSIYLEEGKIKIGKSRMKNIKSMNILEKLLASVSIGRNYQKTYNKYFACSDIDLVLFSTPPVTFYSLISYIKRKTGCKVFLMLKDIYPQSLVDLGYLSKKNPLYFYLKWQEKRTYQVSNWIGCMSRANMDYLLSHNKQIAASKVLLFPNSLDSNFRSISCSRMSIRTRYDLPLDKTMFIYGGTLGRAQGIPFLLECLNNEKQNNQIHFVVVGGGSRYRSIERFIAKNRIFNVSLFERVGKDEFDELVYASDVGLIFLDHRFTIPNYPSRLLTYLKYKLPILAATDKSTDIKDTIYAGDFGWWIESVNPDDFSNAISEVLKDDLQTRGQAAYQYFMENFDVTYNYNAILEIENECTIDGARR